MKHSRRTLVVGEDIHSWAYFRGDGGKESDRWNHGTTCQKIVPIVSVNLILSHPVDNTVKLLPALPQANLGVARNSQKHLAHAMVTRRG